MMTRVPPNMLSAFWSIAREMLKDAVYADGFGDETLEALLCDLYDLSAQLWVSLDQDEVPRAFVVTRIVSKPTGKSLQIQYAGGRGPEHWLVEAREVLLDFARDTGCNMVELFGRPGWQRLLGVKPRAIACGMLLEH